MTRTGKWWLALTIMVTAMIGCGSASQADQASKGTADQIPAGTQAQTALATFAGGCFWCMEPPFDKLPGVISTTSGYTGGHLDNPTYKQVTKGNTGHYEAVQIAYDPTQVTYPQLLHIFWRNIDPLDNGGQFCDRGDSYRTAVFFHDAAQEALALESRADVTERFEETIATPLIEASTFYPAEDYHQNYYKKNPIRYNYYRRSCRRDGRLEQVWGDEAGG